MQRIGNNKAVTLTCRITGAEGRVAGQAVALHDQVLEALPGARAPDRH
ncbi:MAG: hypothetical protein R3298_09755 [Gammaproteobacteria bacterium]|nr:hypothetical protein [Gammaproteobacteria bacterium]